MKIAVSVYKMDRGGIATTVLNLCRIFMDADHEVTIIAQQPGEWWSKLVTTSARKYLLPHHFWQSQAGVVQRFVQYVVAQEFDLLIVFLDLENRLSMLGLHQLPDHLPVALALRNHMEQIYELAAINRRAWNCAIGVSIAVQQAAAMRFAGKPVRYIPNGIDWQHLRSLPMPRRWMLPLRLLFVGRLEARQKGIFRLPAIVAACQKRQLNVQLTIIGDGPDRARLQQLVAQHDLSQQIEFCGAQEPMEIFQAMRSHHIFLLTSNFEGFPNVLLEAQANGCVPIAAHLVDITDTIVQDSVTGYLVEPDNTEAYAAAIQSLANYTWWQQCSMAGIDYVQEHYSLEKVGDLYLALLTELVQDRYPLPIARTQLRQMGSPSYRWRDYLPQWMKWPWHLALLVRRTVAMDQSS